MLLTTYNVHQQTSYRSTLPSMIDFLHEKYNSFEFPHSVRLGESLTQPTRHVAVDGFTQVSYLSSSRLGIIKLTSTRAQGSVFDDK